MSNDIVPAHPIRSAAESPDLAYALGDIILAWSIADRHLSILLGAMLSLDDHQAKRLYFRIASFDARVKMILTLIDLFPDYKPTCRYVLKLSSLSKRRNGYVHNAYLAEMGGQGIWLVDYGQPNDHEKRSRATKATDMKQHADAVRRTTERLHGALREVPPYKAGREARVRLLLEAHHRRYKEREGGGSPLASEA